MNRKSLFCDSAVPVVLSKQHSALYTAVTQSYLLIYLIMAANGDWYDFFFLDYKFNCEAVAQSYGNRIYSLQFVFQGMEAK